MVQHPYISAAVLLLWSFYPQLPFHLVYFLFYVIPRSILLDFLACIGFEREGVRTGKYRSRINTLVCSPRLNLSIRPISRLYRLPIPGLPLSRAYSEERCIRRFSIVWGYQPRSKHCSTTRVPLHCRSILEVRRMADSICFSRSSLEVWKGVNGAVSSSLNQSQQLSQF